MKKFIAGMMLASLVMVPMVGVSAEVNPQVIIGERAAQSLAQVEAAYQKALAIRDAAQKASDLAAAALEKAQADLKLAEASGDTEKIRAATAVMIKAKLDAESKAGVLSQVSALVVRMKGIVDNARDAAAAVTKAKTAREATLELNKLENFGLQAQGVLQTLDEAMKPKARVEIMGLTIPSTTTSTTRPTPTEVGKIRG